MSDQPTSFKMIPDQAELDALERDLTFYRHPKMSS